MKTMCYRLSPQWICGCTLLVPMNHWVLSKLNKEHDISGHKWFTTHMSFQDTYVFMITYILCSPFITVRFEHSVRRGSPMTTYIMLLAQLLENSLVHWYQQCVTVPHVLNCMSCHKFIMMITGRPHCFHDNIYIMLILLICINNSRRHFFLN